MVRGIRFHALPLSLGTVLLCDLGRFWMHCFVSSLGKWSDRLGGEKRGAQVTVGCEL